MNEEKDLPAEEGSAGEKSRDWRDLIKTGMEKTPEELELAIKQAEVKQSEESVEPGEMIPETPKEEGVPVPPPEEKPPAEQAPLPSSTETPKEVPGPTGSPGLTPEIKVLPPEIEWEIKKPRDLTKEEIDDLKKEIAEKPDLNLQELVAERLKAPAPGLTPEVGGPPEPPPSPPAETEAPKRPPVPPETETGPQPSGPTEGAPTEPMVSEWRTPIRETLQKAKDEMAREPDISLEELVKQKLREARGLVKPKEQVPQKEQSSQIPPKKGKIEKKRQVFYLTDQQVKKLKKHAIDLGKRYSDVVGDLIDVID